VTQSCFVENVCTCVCGRPRDCKLLITRLVGAVRSERIVPSPDVERRETRTGEGRGGRASLDGFAASLAKNDTVIVRVHHADHGEKAERYYVAKIATKPWQLQEGGIYCDNQYDAGWWVARIFWYHFDTEQRNGDRLYVLKKGSQEGVVWSVNAFVSGLDQSKLAKQETVHSVEQS